jgi:DNA-3-methyladenine glycosylase II
LSCVELDERSLHQAVAVLCAQDPALRRVIERYGPPPLWARPEGFPTLLHIILEQQVSLASARAAFARVSALANPLTPQSFCALDDLALRTAGFSRQKTSYGRALAEAILNGKLDLVRLHTLDDEAATNELMGLKGIGHWTAQIYLLMALRRPDVWPAGDRALAVGAWAVLDLAEPPDAAELSRQGERWRPWRSVAARILWHYYLSR